MAHSRLQQPHLIHFAAMSLIGLLLGSSFLATKEALHWIGPWTLTAFRLTIATAMVGLWVLGRRKSLPGSLAAFKPILWIALFNAVAPYFLITWAVQTTDSALVAILTATGPIIALVISHFLSTDDRFDTMKCFSIALGFIGVLLTLSSRHAHESFYLPGALAAIGGAACFAIGGNLSRRLQHITPDALTLFVLLTGSVIMLPAACIIEGIPSFEVAPRTGLAVLYLGVFCTGLVYLIRFRLIASVGYTFTSYSGYIIPIAGVLLGAYVLGEPVTAAMIAGMLLILAGAGIRHVPRVTHPIEERQQ